jgi:hypothetical protein
MNAQLIAKTNGAQIGSGSGSVFGTSAFIEDSPISHPICASARNHGKNTDLAQGNRPYRNLWDGE